MVTIRTYCLFPANKTSTLVNESPRHQAQKVDPISLSRLPGIGAPGPGTLFAGVEKRQKKPGQAEGRLILTDLNIASDGQKPVGNVEKGIKD